MNNARPIGLLAHRIAAVDTLVACSGLPLGSVDPTALALPPEPSPYALPTINSGDTVVVTAWWLQDRHSRGIDVVKQVLIPLHDKFRRVVGLDHFDAVSPIFPDEWMSAMDVILKMNGVYRDLELYGFSVGVRTPDGRWTEKTAPAPERFSLLNLRKFVLSIPCLLFISPQHRALMRSFYGTSLLNRSARALGGQVISQLARSLRTSRSARFTVYFAGRLSHIQRLDAARRLRRSSLRWRGGITHIPPYVQGLNRVLVSNPFTDRPLAPAIREELLAQLTAEHLLTPRLSRYQHLLMMRDCKAVLSITGYGELW